MTSNPTFPPLKWVPGSSGGVTAECPFGTYVITVESGRYRTRLYRDGELAPDFDADHQFERVSAAQNYAVTDYAERQEPIRFLKTQRDHLQNRLDYAPRGTLLAGTVSAKQDTITWRVRTKAGESLDIGKVYALVEVGEDE